MLPYLIALLTNVKSSLRTRLRSGLILPAVLFIFLIILGTTVYAWLENWTLLDALYATVITVTTVGYGDLSPQTFGGRFFSIFFTIAAVGLAGYAISTLAVVVIDYETNRNQRSMEGRRMDRIKELRAWFKLA